MLVVACEIRCSRRAFDGFVLGATMGALNISAFTSTGKKQVPPEGAKLAFQSASFHGRGEKGQLLDRLILVLGASDEFVGNVRDLMREKLSNGLLRDVVADGYILEIKDRLRSGRPDLHPDNDYTGGLHSRGPMGNVISIAEWILIRRTGVWERNACWKNGIIHEIGHVLSHLLGVREGDKLKPEESADEAEQARLAELRDKLILLGVTEHPAFREAWEGDHRSIPREARVETIDGYPNSLLYFLEERDGDGFRRARQETFAEGFDILLRGVDSIFNYQNFQTYFPKTLEAIREIVVAQYGQDALG